MINLVRGRRAEACAGNRGGDSGGEHLKTADDHFDSKPSPRTESTVAAAVQWMERIPFADASLLLSPVFGSGPV